MAHIRPEDLVDRGRDALRVAAVEGLVEAAERLLVAYFLGGRGDTSWVTGLDQKL
jgi:hypothetical protein